jgi:hypothetical protein
MPDHRQLSADIETSLKQAKEPFTELLNALQRCLNQSDDAEVLSFATEAVNHLRTARTMVDCTLGAVEAADRKLRLKEIRKGAHAKT